MKRLAYLAAASLAWLALSASAQPLPSPQPQPQPAKVLRQFVYLGQDELGRNLPILDRPDIAGAEVIYPWISLEPRKEAYDFSMVEHDLALTRARGKAMYIEVGD